MVSIIKRGKIIEDDLLEDNKTKYDYYLEQKYERIKDMETKKWERSIIIHKICYFIKSNFVNKKFIDKVYLINKGGFIKVITIINKANKKIEDSVFSCEYDLMKKFKKTKFDFLLMENKDEINLSSNAVEIK